MKNVEVNDLRSAIEMLESIPGQLVETDVEVDPNAELSGVYRHVGAGGTVERPTQEGPAMIFNNVKGNAGATLTIKEPYSLTFLLKISNNKLYLCGM